MKTIKQGRKDDNCSAAVAAMICGTSIEHFNKIMGKARHKYKGLDDGYCPEEIADYLSMHHKQLGYGGFSRTDIDFRKKTILCTFNILKYNAYVAVKSMRVKGAIHAVYWDRDIQMIRDPNPFVLARTKLNIYVVLQWYPIYNQSCAFNKVRKNPELKDILKKFL